MGTRRAVPLRDGPLVFRRELAAVEPGPAVQPLDVSGCEPNLSIVLQGLTPIHNPGIVWERPDHVPWTTRRWER
jgi:hypothetical protein